VACGDRGNPAAVAMVLAVIGPSLSAFRLLDPVRQAREAVFPSP
jgi:hypothetical protein